MWRQILAVFAKESIDNARDRRSMLLALVYPLLGPVLLGVMIAVVTSMIALNRDRPMHLVVDGIERAPGLAAYLTERGVRLRPAPADAEVAVRRGRMSHMLIIPEDFAEALAARRPASITLFGNFARLSALVAVNRTIGLLSDYNQKIRAERLAGEGIDPDFAEPLEIETVNVTSTLNIANIILLMVPPFIIFTVFMGGVYLAIDTTSGERERGSLEPLLINPVERGALMVGKFLAALLFTAVAVAVQLVAFKITFHLVSAPDSVFVRNFNLLTMLGLFVVALPLMMLAVGVQIIIATVTRSYKEAQTYLGLLPLIPAIPGMAMVFVPLSGQGWMMALPAFAQTLLFGELVRGYGLALGGTVVSMAVTALAALALLAIAARLYEREKLIFEG